MIKKNNFIEMLFDMQFSNLIKNFDLTKKIYEENIKLLPDDEYIKNKALNEYELAAGKFVLNSKPRNLRIVIFDKCNSNCIMCSEKDRKHGTYFLDEKYIVEMQNWLPYLDKITWLGGEVFLWDKFIDLLKKISCFKRINQQIVTNLQCVGNTEIKKLAAVNNIKLVISVDGASKKTYEKIRKGSDFNKLNKNLVLLNKYKKKFKSEMSLHLNFVVLKENFREIPDIIDFAKKYNFDTVSLLKCQKTDNYNSDFDTETKSEIEKMIKFALVKSAVSKVKLNVSYPADIVKQIQNKNIKSERIICKLPYHKLMLSENYTFAPECTCIGRKDYFNKNISLEDMWNSDIMQGYRKNIFGTESNKDICNKNCYYYCSSYMDGINTNGIY